MDGDPGSEPSAAPGSESRWTATQGKNVAPIQNVSRRRSSQLISHFVRSVRGVLSFKYCFNTAK